ncbi:hypothetical protein Y1Q_0019322 [Alligator mississippiensis]|uniref:Uncharacterized protein n=1 Tax=Alligator mississippiensis TaxID=8496 RepID=A0A151MR64_ALLMI|nr:hypothetical protein Y1Q_0019322 [Alligator mississippiensis]
MKHTAKRVSGILMGNIFVQHFQDVQFHMCTEPGRRKVLASTHLHRSRAQEFIRKHLEISGGIERSYEGSWVPILCPSS